MRPQMAVAGNGEMVEEEEHSTAVTCGDAGEAEKAAYDERQSTVLVVAKSEEAEPDDGAEDKGQGMLSPTTDAVASSSGGSNMGDDCNRTQLKRKVSSLFKRRPPNIVTRGGGGENPKSILKKHSTDVDNGNNNNNEQQRSVATGVPQEDMMQKQSLAVNDAADSNRRSGDTSSMLPKQKQRDGNTG